MIWVGGIHPDHIIKEEDYDQNLFVQAKMASEIKVGMLAAQGFTDGTFPFKIIAACPQATNEVSEEYNSTILRAVDEIENVHCVSMSFDGLAAETNFIRTNLISFMKGNINMVVMTDCNHRPKIFGHNLFLEVI